MNSNPQPPQPSLFDSQPIDWPLSVPDSSQLVTEARRLHELRHQVAVQEQKLNSLRQKAADVSNSHVPSAEQDVMKSLIFTKERELAMALMKVAELTSQLEHLRRNQGEESKPTPRMLETNTQPKANVPKIIPIRIIREDVPASGDTKKVLRRDADTELTPEGNSKSVRVIPIIFDRTVQFPSSSISSAIQQPQGASFVSHRLPVQTGEKSSSTVDKDSNMIGTTAEFRKGTIVDVNENVQDRGKAVASLPTDLKNSATVNCVVVGNGRPNEFPSEKVAVEKVYVEKIGKTKYSYGKAENEKINVAVLDNERTMENKFENSSDFMKRGNVIDKQPVENRTAVVRGDAPSKIGVASHVNEIADREILVKDKKNAVNRSHSMGEKTDVDRRLFHEQKEHSAGRNSHSRTIDVGSNNRNEENKAKNFSQDKKSFSDFSLSKQLAGLSEESSKVDSAEQFGNAAVTCRNKISDDVRSQYPSGPNKTSESGFKADRARFFMDMVKENAVETGGVQPWMEMPRSPVSAEFRKLVSPIVSPATSASRGRSSSSAIMSRFAPQPYGRSKSVDSGSLRIPMAALSAAMNRGRSPDMAVGIAENASRESASSCKMPTQHSIASSYNHQSGATMNSPGAISERHIEVETTVSSSRMTPRSLFSQESVSSDGSSCQARSVSSHNKSFPEMKIEVKSILSPSERLTSNSRPSLSKSQTNPAAVLVADRVEILTPSTSIPLSVSSSLRNSSAKQPSSTHEYSSAIESTVSPVSSVSYGTTKSFYAKPPVASADITTTLPPSHNTKSSSAELSSVSSTAAVPPNSTTFQQNSHSSSESKRPLVCSTKSSCEISSSVKPRSCVSLSSSLSIADAKTDYMNRSVDIKNDEEITDTAWDSNVKRLAHIYAVTIGGTVQGRASLTGDRNRELRGSCGRDGNAEVQLFPYGSGGSFDHNAVKHSRAEPSSAVSETGSSWREQGSSRSSYQNPSDGATVSDIPLQKTMQCSGVVIPSSPEVTNSVDQLKIDTSADSVNSALSVLLKSNAVGHSSPVRPSRLRTTISSAYRRKLGSGALDNYSQNMTLLYGDGLGKNDGSASSDVQEQSEEIASSSSSSPPLQETPLIEDLPRILALDALDGMPFYPRISSHLHAQGSSVDIINGRADEEQSRRDELLKSGDVELTVISSPKQTADLVSLDSADSNSRFSNSFNPSDDIVSSYIDDPLVADGTRFSSEPASQPHDRFFTRRNGRPRRRVTFDNISLLLNAALEGEKDLVVDIINKSPNPNQKTETGLSALHNAVCGNHADILRYMVEFGCDVNAADNDGWTPLHCAASTNNVELMKILVENGASILPMTISDRETPVQKCSRNLPAYEEAVKYLTGVADSLGIASDGWVYVTSNFANVCFDELVLSAGNRLKIIRRGDENESEWWWAKSGDAEGYVPQSLLALYPRVHPRWMK